MPPKTSEWDALVAAVRRPARPRATPSQPDDASLKTPRSLPADQDEGQLPTSSNTPTDQDNPLPSAPLQKKTESNSLPPSADPALDSDNEGNDSLELPFQNEATLSGHSRTVFALDIDPSGSRLCSGSLDGALCLWDFGGMDASLRPFRSFHLPTASNEGVVDVSWSHTGDSILVASRSCSPHLLDRNGNQLAEFAKGDMYIRDPRQTSGHTAALTSALWRPGHRNIFATASTDATLRIWDVEMTRKHNAIIVFTHGTGAHGVAAKPSVSALGFSRDGTLLAAGATNGMIRLWKSAGPYSSASQTISDAHSPGVPITSVSFAWDHKTLLSRSMDGTLKLWDMRKPKQPLAINSDLPCASEAVTVTWSPDESTILISTTQKLCVLDRCSLNLTHTIPLQSKQHGRLLWHAKLNQVFLGGDPVGRIHAWFGDSNSLHGIARCISRVPRQRQADDLHDILAERAPKLIASDKASISKAMREATGETSGLTKKRTKASVLTARRPELPPTSKPEKAHGGGSILNSSGLKPAVSHNIDPREAILRYRDVAEKEPYWVAPAYRETQPKPVLAQSVLEPDELERIIEDEDRQSAKRRRM